MKNTKNITFEGNNLTSLNDLQANTEIRNSNRTDKGNSKIMHGLKQEERISNNTSRKFKENIQEKISNVNINDKSPSFAIGAENKLITSEKNNYVTNERGTSQLEHIQEIPSDDDGNNILYVPRKSTRTGLFTREELNIREDNLRGGSHRSGDVFRMQPESEGNISYFKENSSYYANSPEYSRKSSHKDR